MILRMLRGGTIPSGESGLIGRRKEAIENINEIMEEIRAELY